MSENHTLKNHSLETDIFRSRTFLAFLVVLALTFTLVGRMYYLQVVEFKKYTTQSDDNRMHVQPLPPTRGLIYDRNGVLLADNRPSYSLTVVREQVRDVEQMLAILSDILALSEEDVASMRERLMQRRRPFEPILIRSQLTEQDIAKIAVNRYRLPGVDVEARLTRYYPLGETLAHVLGYVGRINERELQKLDATEYSGTHYIGKTGVERVYEPQLHGKVGYQKVETNARGRVLSVLERHPPEPGQDLVLHLDSGLQRVAQQAMGKERGSIVAIDPKTGGVLAMVSTPAFDPNLFVSGIDSKTYAKLRRSRDLPLFNRSIRGRYPPASTIKPFMALAALEEGVVTRDKVIYDPGWYQLPNDDRLYRNWKRTGHGRVNLHRALVVSNDTYFYDLAYNLGIDNISEHLSRFGFGQRTDYDLDRASAGLLPSREWKRNTKRQPWYPGETLSVGIGQGYMLSTPLQLATATAVLANRGQWVQPRLAKTINTKEVPVRLPDTPPDVKLSTEKNWDYMFDVMEDVVHSSRGTARRISHNLTYRIAGKTGTAQVVTIKQDEVYDEEKLAERHRDHALFVGFAPADDPQIAVAVIVENGGGGSSTAAPIARQVFDAYLLPRLQRQKEAMVVSRDE